MKHIFFVLLLSLATLSCKNDDKKNHERITNSTITKVTDTATINGILLELTDHNGQAGLRINSKEYRVSGSIKISPPCYFLRWEKNTIENFSYPDYGVDHALAILGNTTKQNDQRTCGTHLQGILFKKENIIITNTTLTQSFSCTDTGADEKVFWGFAHE
ncbi:hypothetical protein DRF67_06900 [Chryseobacterium pennipullorum]|uniref:Lipoprotein n=2 Tax=Chryseobacterium pennipullorum TaxID=2258963 RepID=A0A3D9B4D3_9FLAO|nr:hypothetical protein DRF67_06900 [Chryseobacterium pennipullorum]